MIADRVPASILRRIALAPVIAVVAMLFAVGWAALLLAQGVMAVAGVRA